MQSEMKGVEPPSEDTQWGRFAFEAPRTIAIADDDPETLELVCASLEREGVELLPASSGAELVAILAEHRGALDLVITDVNMPWMDGLSFLETARKAHVDVPVLVITGRATSRLQATVERLKDVRLLKKPFGVDALRSSVMELLGAKAGADSRMKR